MSGFLSKKYLKYRGLLRRDSQSIDNDVFCKSCGYNLRGLTTGTRCPECGALPLRIECDDDPLSLMPRPIIVSFICGCWTATIAIIGMIGISATNAIVMWDAVSRVTCFVALAIVWNLAVWLLTPGLTHREAVWRGFSMMNRWRHYARWLQLGWIIVAGSNLLYELIPNPTPGVDALCSGLIWIGILAGLVGVEILIPQLQELATWVRDYKADRLLNWSMWLIPIVILFLIAETPILWSPFSRFGLIVLVFWIVIVLTFPLAIVFLTKSVTLSYAHSIEYEELLKRKAERRAEVDEELNNRIERMQSARQMKPGKPVR